jgi:hypothetical protein
MYELRPREGPHAAQPTKKCLTIVLLRCDQLRRTAACFYRSIDPYRIRLSELRTCFVNLSVPLVIDDESTVVSITSISRSFENCTFRAKREDARQAANAAVQHDRIVEGTDRSGARVAVRSAAPDGPQLIDFIDNPPAPDPNPPPMLKPGEGHWRRPVEARQLGVIRLHPRRHRLAGKTKGAAFRTAPCCLTVRSGVAQFLDRLVNPCGATPHLALVREADLLALQLAPRDHQIQCAL